jgi:hypothetical protein
VSLCANVAGQHWPYAALELSDLAQRQVRTVEFTRGSGQEVVVVTNKSCSVRDSPPTGSKQ